MDLGKKGGLWLFVVLLALIPAVDAACCTATGIIGDGEIYTQAKTASGAFSVRTFGLCESASPELFACYLDNNNDLQGDAAGGSGGCAYIDLESTRSLPAGSYDVHVTGSDSPSCDASSTATAHNGQPYTIEICGDGFTPDCGSNPTCSEDQIIMRLASGQNAHIGEYDQTQYPIPVCYDQLFGRRYTGSDPHTCANDLSNVVLKVASPFNAHAQEPNPATVDYNTNICYGDLNCRISTESCTAPEVEVMRLASQTNAHVGLTGSTYGHRLCCASNVPPSCLLSSVEIDLINDNTHPGFADAGETIRIRGTVNDLASCQATGAAHIQVDAHDTARACVIQFIGGAISGIESSDIAWSQIPVGTGTIDRLEATWTVPSIPQQCEGLLIEAQGSALRDSPPDVATEIIGEVLTASGSFTFYEPRCGNGFTDPAGADGQISTTHDNEFCDDGNSVDDDTCPNNCQQPICGDNIIQSHLSERCDDGNADSTDTCANCQPTVCGDSIIQTPNGNSQNEVCDEGASNGDWCTTSCQIDKCEICGTAGVLGVSTRAQCEGVNSGDNNCAWRGFGIGFCFKDADICGGSTCGDGTLDNDGFDDAWGQRGVDDDGDGTIDEREGEEGLGDDEECDDGNLATDDGCNRICKIEDCGDGIIQTPNANGFNELCDDGNSDNTDLCTDTCTFNTCLVCDDVNNGILGSTEDACLNANGGNNNCAWDPVAFGRGVCYQEPVACGLCGNSRVDRGEDCDPALDADCSAACEICNFDLANSELNILIDNGREGFLDPGDNVIVEGDLRNSCGGATQVLAAYDFSGVACKFEMQTTVTEATTDLVTPGWTVPSIPSLGLPNFCHGQELQLAEGELQDSSGFRLALSATETGEISFNPCGNGAPNANDVDVSRSNLPSRIKNNAQSCDDGSTDDPTYAEDQTRDAGPCITDPSEQVWCLQNTCGDGYLNWGPDGLPNTGDAGEEQCDDGNTDETDLCDNSCQTIHPCDLCDTAITRGGCDRIDNLDPSGDFCEFTPGFLGFGTCAETAACTTQDQCQLIRVQFTLADNQDVDGDGVIDGNSDFLADTGEFVRVAVEVNNHLECAGKRFVHFPAKSAVCTVDWPRTRADTSFHMQGIEIPIPETLTSNTFEGLWEVPAIAQECFDERVFPGQARIWDGTPYGSSQGSTNEVTPIGNPILGDHITFASVPPPLPDLCVPTQAQLLPVPFEDNGNAKADELEFINFTLLLSGDCSAKGTHTVHIVDQRKIDNPSIDPDLVCPDIIATSTDSRIVPGQREMGGSFQVAGVEDRCWAQTMTIIKSDFVLNDITAIGSIPVIGSFEYVGRPVVNEVLCGNGVIDIAGEDGDIVTTNDNEECDPSSTNLWEATNCGPSCKLTLPTGSTVIDFNDDNQITDPQWIDAQARSYNGRGWGAKSCLTDANPSACHTRRSALINERLYTGANSVDGFSRALVDHHTITDGFYGLHLAAHGIHIGATYDITFFMGGDFTNDGVSQTDRVTTFVDYPGHSGFTALLITDSVLTQTSRSFTIEDQLLIDEAYFNFLPGSFGAIQAIVLTCVPSNGGIEIPGDGIDQDCDGADPAAPVASFVWNQDTQDQDVQVRISIQSFDGITWRHFRTIYPPANLEERENWKFLRLNAKARAAADLVAQDDLEVFSDGESGRQTRNSDLVKLSHLVNRVAHINPVLLQITHNPAISQYRFVAEVFDSEGRPVNILASQGGQTQLQRIESQPFTVTP